MADGGARRPRGGRECGGGQVAEVHGTFEMITVRQ
jgi:hypothetical protein